MRAALTRSLLLPLSAAALIVLPFAARLPLLRERSFNPDELQHLHGAWCISKGMLPYRDYFDHHTPGLHFLLGGLLPFFDVDAGFENIYAFILFARAMMWASTGVVLFLTFQLAKRWRGAPTAWVATVFLTDFVLFLSKTIEIRPDVPALALSLASLAAMTRGMDARETGRRRPRWLFFASGLFFGASLMCTQKLLLAGPGLFIAMVWYVAGKKRVPLRERLAHGALYAAGGAAPVLATAAYFAWRGGLGPFVELNFFLNLRWKARLSAFGVVRELWQQNSILAVLGTLGVLVSLWRIFRGARFDPERTVLTCTTLSLFVGLFLIPVPQRQYALLFLPLLAIFAAVSFRGIVDRLPFSRGRESAATALLLLLSIYPLYELKRQFSRNNWDTIENLRFVAQNAAPTETVMDGFTGLGTFRPHAYYYYYLHPEIRALLTEHDAARLLARLRSGDIRPKLVFLDKNLRDLSPDFLRFIEQNYAPLGPEPIRGLLYDNGAGTWTDEGRRHLVGGRDRNRPHLFIGDGWHQAEVVDEVVCRRSRGRRSSLLVPIRDPDAFAVTLCARLEWHDRPVHLRLAVNGHPLGRAALEPGWREYRFSLPASAVRSGFNNFDLSYSETPYAADPGYRGRNTVLALEYLDLTRTR